MTRNLSGGAFRAAANVHARATIQRGPAPNTRTAPMYPPERSCLRASPPLAVFAPPETGIKTIVVAATVGTVSRSVPVTVTLQKPSGFVSRAILIHLKIQQEF
jgi:hypothetical protein